MGISAEAELTSPNRKRANALLQLAKFAPAFGWLVIRLLNTRLPPVEGFFALPSPRLRRLIAFVATSKPNFIVCLPRIHVRFSSNVYRISRQSSSYPRPKFTGTPFPPVKET